MEAECSAAQDVGDSVKVLSWGRIIQETWNLIERHVEKREIYGIPTGGSVIVALMSQTPGYTLIDHPKSGALIIDDLVDTGKTLNKYVSLGYEVDALFRKPYSPSDIAPNASNINGWLAFPWEHTTTPEDAVQRLIQYTGEDPNREGLIKTPSRYIKALHELTEGYRQDPSEILSRVFEEKYDQMVLVRGIEFWSLCEHHLLPFHGEAVVGYIPNGRIVGLSKIARLVRCYSRRLQVQERMTEQIAHAIEDNLNPMGVGVLIHGFHSCMAMRGIQCKGEMITSCLLGVIRERGRDEFLRLADEKGS